jgi:TRAP-type uncharacterized transport system substrate-binding protein
MQQQSKGYYVDDQAMYTLRSPATMRARLMLEVASELAALRTWPHRQPRIQMRAQGAEEWGVTLFGSDSPNAVHEVARGDVTFAIVNPSAVLALAIRGRGPYKEPVPVRGITVLPQYDQLGFAVHERTGITSFRELRERKYPLRVSVRGQRDHSVLVVIDEILKALDLSLEDFQSWGGEVRYEPGMPNFKIDNVVNNQLDAIFDEAMPMYAGAALDAGMRFLRFEDAELHAIDALGLRRVKLTREDYASLQEDTWAIDFSGWTVYTHADVPDEVVAHFCGALEARKDRIPFFALDGFSAGEGALPLDQMCHDTREGPLYVPLHPAAERFWRDRGHL